jgi:hypothetical protein
VRLRTRFALLAAAAAIGMRRRRRRLPIFVLIIGVVLAIYVGVVLAGVAL